MASKQSPEPKLMEPSLSLSEQANSKKAKLPCIGFLKTHFEERGLDEKGYKMLHRMIEMISAIGFEMHVIYSSKIPSEGSKLKIQRYLSCISQGCEAFSKNMNAAVEKAENASRVLPKLEGTLHELQLKLQQWETELSTLHKPTGNDALLFREILDHFDKNGHGRLVMINVRKPKYELQHLEELAEHVHNALIEICQLADEADRLVIELEEKFQRTKGMAIRANAAMEPQSPGIRQSQEGHYFHDPQRSGRYAGDVTSKPLSRKSFSAVEDARRSHLRTTTVPDTDYSISEGFEETGIRRKGTNVPRIFTGSFSQLETELRQLQFDKIKTPDDQDIDDPVKVRDFGATPGISPCTTPCSPTPPLQRREAMLTKEIEFQDRVINGEVISSRRPSTKGRALTIDDNTGGLQAWLKEEPSGAKAPDAPDFTVRRGNARHREHTL